MRSILTALMRVMAVVGKELVETMRRPWAVLSIVLGPFLILILFGLGYIGQAPIRAAVVIPAGSDLPGDTATYEQAANGAIDIVAIDTDPAAARARLTRGEVDLIVVAPADWQKDIAAGQQAVLSVEFDSISPYATLVATNAAARIEALVNREFIRQVATQAIASARSANASLPPSVQPDLISAPARADVRDLAPTAPSITWFYGTAVLVLIVQHVAVTLGALSMFRDQRRGLVELFRLAPVRTAELLLGKYIAIGLISAIVAVAFVGLLVGPFNLPILGDPGRVAVAIALLIAAATGLGLVIALASDSERQVVQLTLLVLLASVFFGGLAVDLTQFSWPIQRGAEALPVTQATRILQDVMLRGGPGEIFRYVILALIGILLMGLAAVLLRRTLAPKK